MALNATAVTEVTLKDAQKLPAGSVLMFKFGAVAGDADSSRGWPLDRDDRGVHAPGLHGAVRAAGRPHPLRVPRRRVQRIYRRQRERPSAQAAQALQSGGQRYRACKCLARN